jgi:ABC-type methionine transport system ATPase subunit
VPVADYPVRELRRRVGFIFQTPTLFAGTVADNLRIAGELSEREPGERLTMREAMAAAELDPALLERPGERLSGGERQRATIARALIGAPEVLLMDEPTSALDGETAARLVETVVRMSRERGLTVVLVTHRREEARGCGGAVALLERGRIAAFGPAREVLRAGDEVVDAPPPGR